MDYPLAGPLDARGYEIKQFKIWMVNGFPTATTALEGVIAYNTATDEIRVCDGTAWLLRASDSALLGGEAKSFFQDLANIPNGNLDWSRVSGGQAAINATKLNALSAPDGPIDINGQKVTGSAAASASTDLVRKAEFDDLATIANSAAAGVAYKLPVRAADTVGVTQSGPQTVDGVALIAGDRYLRAVGSSALNGLWVVQAGAHTRAPDADTNGELAPGTQVVVTEGTNGNQPWYLVSDSAVTIGTTAQTWDKLPYPAGEIVTPGAGLTKTGSTLDVGAGTGITVNADDVQVKRGNATDLTTNARVPLVKEMNITGAATATVDLAHGLGYQFPIAVVYENNAGTWAEVGGIGKEPYSTTNMRFFFGATPADGQYKVVFYG